MHTLFEVLRNLQVVVFSALAVTAVLMWRKGLDMALRRVGLAEQERKNLEAMRDFVAIAAHDLRTPVTVISGFASLLASQWAELNDTERLEMVGSIERQSGHLARLTEELLILARLEMEEVVVHPSTLVVKPAIERIVNDLAAEYSAVAEVRVDPGLTVYVDPDHFNRIVSNYLGNAYVYGKPPFRIEASSGDGKVTIFVKDEGDGVPTEFARSLFAKFARADKKMSKASHGTGLGLSIVKGLAQVAGGRVWYEPNGPSGSAFAVQLPKAAAK